jgi:hypothetical protein
VPSEDLVNCAAELIHSHGFPFIPDTELEALAEALTRFLNRPSMQEIVEGYEPPNFDDDLENGEDSLRIFSHTVTHRL